MIIGIESLLFLFGGIILAVILTQVFGRGAGASRAATGVRGRGGQAGTPGPAADGR